MTDDSAHDEAAASDRHAGAPTSRQHRPDGHDSDERTGVSKRPDGGTTETANYVNKRVSGTPLERVGSRLRNLQVRPLDVLVYGLYGTAVAFFAFPVLWVVSASVRPEGELLSFPFQLIPTEVSLTAYGQVFREGMLSWLFNSTVVTVVGVGSILVVSVPAAYAFSRFEFRGRRQLLGLVLLFQMISSVVIIVPLYSVMSSLGLINTRAGLILLYVGIQTPFSIWLLKGYFDTIPKELDYAARIDGCNRFQTLTVLTWSEFVLTYTVLGSARDLWTISIGVYEFQSQFGNDWRAIAAASVVGMLPLVVTFVALQRYFIKGLIEGSLKG